MKNKKLLVIGMAIIAIFMFSFSLDNGILDKFSSKESPIAKNATINNMFQQKSHSLSQEHKDKATQNWIEKYFNINW